MTVWVDVVSRARGLRTHRLTPSAVRALHAAADLGALGRGLMQAGYPVADGERDAAALDLAVRRRAATELRVLVRWCGDRSNELPVIFQDEDRRSLRALLRGSLQGSPAAERLRGLVPTGTLPERALSELAGLPTPSAIAALLTAWNHPFAPDLRRAAQSAAPDPLALDLALDRAWAGTAVAGAHRGGPALQRFVEDAIDLANVATVLALAGRATVQRPDLFLNGGGRVHPGEFAALLRLDRVAAARGLAALLAGTPFARVLGGGSLGGLEDALLSARVAAQRRDARRAPLGPAPVLWYALELRAETIAVSRAIWSLALGAPGDAVGSRL